MKSLHAKWITLRERQQQHPTGFLGRLVGEQMRRQHARETAWTIDLLGLRPTDRVLELGFGAGQGLALPLKRASQGKVTGADMSATMVRAAASRNRSAYQRGQLSLVQGDIEKLPFRRHQFEKIFRIQTFYFLTRPGDFLDHQVGLLADGGRLVFTFATANILPGGQKAYWPIHDQAAALVDNLRARPQLAACFAAGPDARGYNTMAIVLDRQAGGQSGAEFIGR